MLDNLVNLCEPGHEGPLWYVRAVYAIMLEMLNICLLPGLHLLSG